MLDPYQLGDETDYESILNYNNDEYTIDDEYVAENMYIDHDHIYNEAAADNGVYGDIINTISGGAVSDKNVSSGHEMLSYNPYEFVSKCCRGFIFYDKLSIYCSKCGKEVDKIKDGQAITISMKFNSNTDSTSISGDVLRAFHNSIPRFATDPTCELCERKCKKCSTKMRYLRDRKGDMWYVCSNGDCRHVDGPSDLIANG